MEERSSDDLKIPEANSNRNKEEKQVEPIFLESVTLFEEDLNFPPVFDRQSKSSSNSSKIVITSDANNRRIKKSIRDDIEFVKRKIRQLLEVVEDIEMSFNNLD